jgi:hypothetical protein
LSSQFAFSEVPLLQFLDIYIYINIYYIYYLYAKMSESAFRIFHTDPDHNLTYGSASMSGCPINNGFSQPDPDPIWPFLMQLKLFFQNGSKSYIFYFLIILNSFAEIFPSLMK